MMKNNANHNNDIYLNMHLSKHKKIYSIYEVMKKARITKISHLTMIRVSPNNLLKRKNHPPKMISN